MVITPRSKAAHFAKEQQTLLKRSSQERSTSTRKLKLLHGAMTKTRRSFIDAARENVKSSASTRTQPCDSTDAFKNRDYKTASAIHGIHVECAFYREKETTRLTKPVLEDLEHR